jgi:tetratricopeptide (TPR) repeat protein
VSLGIISMNYYDYQEAEKEFNLVLTHYSEIASSFLLARAHLNLGKINSMKGKYLQVEQEYLKALELFPLSARIHTELGKCYAQQGLYKKALDYFNKAKHINSAFTPAYINSGITYELMGSYVEARREWKKALEIYPNAPGARERLNRLESKLK